ncbi:hypothetical protein H0H81_000770 [Sphagnurus paluster]|uniref:Uncharacterized protein n=1 Tax=Sphagnurus paluster TaxID=117069 RepID=A0A9P7KK75_9AGAR|nr:hypothetical protein H0H81_000770 [Sphagnurus paluster]
MDVVNARRNPIHSARLDMDSNRMPPPERRDSNLDSNGSVNQFSVQANTIHPDQLTSQTPFQTHQSLGQALGSHIPGLAQNGGPQQAHPGPPSSLFTVTPGHTSPGMKRKQVDTSMNTQVLKRRRDADDGDTFDVDGSGQGAKHWTDEEKSKLFRWLMGPGQDAHWNSLRATKNSCLRECANEVFGSKKTYQALKGCYERNFNLFKQIYSFEMFHGHPGGLSSLNEADRLREYERRLQSARKASCDVGNITARTIDHWHRVGWYDLFYRRWHGDPATTRPVQSRNSNASGSNQNGGDEPEIDDDPPQIGFPDPIMMSNGINTPLSQDRSHPHPIPNPNPNPISYINPQTLRDPIPPPPSLSPTAASSGLGAQNGTPISATIGSSSSSSTPANSDQAVLNLTVTQAMSSTFMQYLQIQIQTGKMKLEYMRRREEREEKESAERRDYERKRMEREAAEFEHNKNKENTQRNTDRAMQILENPNLDDSVKKAAGDYLKKFFI